MLLGVLAGGAALASPLDFTPGQKYDALCDGVLLSAEPVPGKGDFTPYWIDGKTRQLLVPYSITLSGDEGLKARHLTPGVPTTKPGKPPKQKLVTCVISGQIRQQDVSYNFSLLVTGQLRDEPRAHRPASGPSARSR